MGQYSVKREQNHYTCNLYFLLFKKKYSVDFDDELKIGDVRHDDMT